MEYFSQLCSLCSKSLESAGCAPQKLLQTPCGHVFHRACLKPWLRRQPTQNFCPDCKISISWQDVRPWQMHPKNSNNSEAKDLESSHSTLVTSEVEDARQKTAEALLQKRLEKQQEKLELERKLAKEAENKRKLDSLKNEMCQDMNAGIKIIKQGLAGYILFVILVGTACLLVYLCTFDQKLKQQEFSTEDVCKKKLMYLEQKQKNHSLQIWDIQEPTSANSQAEIFALQIMRDKINELNRTLLYNEVLSLCEEEMESSRKKMQYLLKVKRLRDIYEMNGWPTDEIRSDLETNKRNIREIFDAL